MATRTNAARRELSMDELMLVAGGDTKPAPGRTGSYDLDKASTR